MKSYKVFFSMLPKRKFFSVSRTFGLLSVLLCASVVSPHAAIIGSTGVPLNGLRHDVRNMETNLGDLIADAFLWQAQQSGHDPTIALENGGAIRGDRIYFPDATIATPALIPDTFPLEVLPFNDTIVTLQNISVPTLLSALENSVSQVEFSSGRFLQIAGFNFTWDPFALAGSRILDVFLDDSTLIIDDGAIASALTLNVTTNVFVAGGGDSYNWGGATFLSTGVTDNQALSKFLQGPLGGSVHATDYPEGGMDRIQPVPEPSTFILLGAGLAGLVFAVRRRRKE